MSIDHEKIEKTLKRSHRLFKGLRFDIHGVEITGKSGKKLKREMIVHPGAVITLPLTQNNEIILIRNERFAVGTALLELPAGTLEEGELPKENAMRELVEETGYQASSIEPLTNFFSSPGICNEVIYTFLATDLTHVGQNLEDGENITVEPYPIETVKEMIYDGRICDAKTLVALMYYFQFKEL